MALVLNDRVKETSTTTGQGTLNLAGAATGFETFVTGGGDGNTTYYVITHATDGTWEIGIGTITDASPDTLARTTVIDTSAGNTTKIDFAAGSKTLFCSLPASKSVFLDADGDVTLAANLTVGGNFDVTGTLDFSDSAITNAGDIQLDSITGDGDTNTSITFSGSDVITIATGGSGRLTIGDGALSPVTDNEIDLGTSSLEFKDAFFDGTVTSDAFAGPLTGDVTGNVSGTAATVTTAAQSNITSLGTLTTLTVDNVIINGSTIGHTGDTDLMTVASGIMTVAGEVSMTTLDIGGTNVTSTAAELNLVDGITAGTVSASLAVIVDSNKDISGFRNVTLTGELDGATLDISGDADIDGTANLDNTDIDGTLVVDGSNISLDSTTTLNIDNSNTTNGITIATATSGVPISIGHSTSETTINDNLTVTGDFTVSGTSTTIDSTTVAVADSMFKLAKDQGTSADALDFGFYGQYGVGGTAKYAGIFRDVSATGDPFTFFDLLQAEPGTTVNTSGTGYDLADIAAGGAAFADAVTTAAITASGIIKTDDATEATSTTDGSLQTDGGLSVVKDAVFGDDASLLSDAAVLGFGADKDVTLTHVADTGLLLNSTMAIQFNDASQFINAPSNAILDINATDEIELNATLVDVNANLDVSGTITSGGVITGTAFTAGSAVLAEAELELLDGLTAGTAIASKVVTTDANIDSTGMRNLTISGEIDAATGDFSGAVDVAGATTVAALTASGIVKTDDATDATSTTDGSLQTDGGLSVAKDAILGNDLKLLSDSAVLVFGAGSDATITHTNDTGLTLNSTNKLMFNDASQFIQGSSATVLSIGATDEIDLTATAVDLNGTLNVSGVATFQATPVFPDGSIAVADLDIDGATDIGAAIVDADLFIIDDGAGGTNRKVTASRLKTYAGGTDLDGAVVINESSADVDFRVESNGNANMFVLDGGANAVLVGTATHDGNATFTVKSADNGSRPGFILNGGEVDTTTYGTRFKMSVTRDDNTSDLMVAGDNTADRFRIFSDGDVVNHDNSYGAISDQRIKQNIRDSNSQWDDIKAVKVRNYKRKDDVRYYGADAWEQIGVVAQELEASGMDKLIRNSEPSSSDILSDAAFGTLYEDGDDIPAGKQIGDIKTITASVKKVAYSILYMKAIKALQEAQTRIETLETKVAALEG